MSDTDELNLDDLFARARNSAPVPHAALYARVSHDAQTYQSAKKPALWTILWSRWATMGGMVAAAVVGLFIGTAMPENVTQFLGRSSGQVTVADGAAQRDIILPDSDILALAGE